MIDGLRIFFSHTFGKSMPIADRNVVKYLWHRLRKDNPSVSFFRILKLVLIAFYMVGRNWRLRTVYCGKDRFVVRSIQGSKMLLDLTDSGLSRELLTASVRETFLTKLLEYEIREGDAVVDIGASIGYYALQEAQLVKSRGIVYAIEPVIGSCSLLVRNIAMNRYRNVKTYNFAIGAHNHNGFIHISKLRNCSKIANIGGDESQPTLVIPLDKFVKGKRHPSLVRMDVEGYEVEIVKGMAELLRSAYPLKIVMELHCNLLEGRMLPMVRTLKDAGFKVKAAMIEAHPVLLNHRVGMKVLSWLDARIGAATGYHYISIDDLLKDNKYRSGQVDYMEILFERR